MLLFVHAVFCGFETSLLCDKVSQLQWSSCPDDTAWDISDTRLMTQSLNQAIKSFGPESTNYDQKLTLTIQLTVKTTDDVGTGISAPLVARVLPPPPLRKKLEKVPSPIFSEGRGGGSVHRVVSVLYRVKQKD